MWPASSPCRLTSEDFLRWGQDAFGEQVVKFIGDILLFGAVNKFVSFTFHKVPSLARKGPIVTDNLAFRRSVYLHLSSSPAGFVHTWLQGIFCFAVMLMDPMIGRWPAMFAMGSDVTPLTPGTLVNTWSTIEFPRGWHKWGGGRYQHVPIRSIPSSSSI